MRVRSSLVWKLSAVVATIMAVAIGFTGWRANRVVEYYCLESARTFLRFNSESIVKGIGQQMMNRNNEGIEDLMVEMSRGSTVYGNIRLVSHQGDHYGVVKASRFGRDDTAPEVSRLGKQDGGCKVCHDHNDLGGDNPKTVDEVIDLAEGGRVLSVMAPILNEPGCGTADCHLGGPRILGFVDAEYSLQRIDDMVAERGTRILLVVLASLAAGVVALWLMFVLLLERPIGKLIAAAQRIAAGQFDFRFDRTRSDEIGVLEESFNTMTTTIQVHQGELRSAKEYLEGMVEHSADIIITVNMEGLIETFNRGGEEALGYRREELIGKPIESLFVDPRERHAAAARLKSTGDVKNYETRLLAKDGQICNVLLTLSRLRDREGNPLGTIGISKDISREKKLQRELVQSQKFAAIGQAVTGIQHAIKNLLNALKGGAYLVRNGMAGENRQRIEEGWVMVEEGIARIGTLSNNMLNYAKEWKLDLQRTELDEMIASICELNRQAAAKQGVAFRCEVPAGLPAVLCDQKLIHMAATDILVNAIDACADKDYAPGETAEIVFRNSLGAEGDFFEIEIRDNGCGMTEEIRRNIFTPFFSTKKTLGTGLGLALTARIIKAHGGEVSAESEPDRGTAFHIRLPVDGPKNL